MATTIQDVACEHDTFFDTKRVAINKYIIARVSWYSYCYENNV